MTKFLTGGYRWFRDLSGKKKTALIGGIIALILISIPLFTYAYFARDIDDADRLMNRNNTGVVLLDSAGEEFYRAYNASTDGENIPLDQMPEHLTEALIATEDSEFYEHSGYSIKGTLAALYGNIINADAYRYGGSTITQQLAKNALLRHDKTYLRKYQELTLAIAIDRRYSKDEILEMYLNSVYFGEGAFGIEDAAQTYFGKEASELNLAESSILIGILPGPSSMSPISGDAEAAKERQEFVLTSMVEEGHITKERKEELLNRELSYHEPTVEQDGTFAQHFANMAIEELEERYGEEQIARSGFRVTTTLNRSWQETAETAVQDQIAQIESAGAENGALVAIDPNNGEIRALVGSADWSNEEFGKVNMATTPRQPGSSFKPIYYTEALAEEVITPATILEDEPTTFGNNYEPENFDFAYRGDITVRRALANSLNIPSVKVMERLGVGEAVNAAQRLGLDTVDDPGSYGLSLALGTAEVPLLDLTNAYAAFANGGQQHETTTIQSIENKYEDTIYNNESEGERVMDEGASFLISSILSDDQARANTFGGSLSLGRPVAVKTGTTEDSRDALTIGYAPNLSVGVWVGNNSNEPMQGIGGSTGAGPIWRQAMQAFLGDLERQDFEAPESVTSVLICRSNGLPANRPAEDTYNEYFIQGTVPEGQCNIPEPEPETDEDEENEEDNQGQGQDQNGSDDGGENGNGNDSGGENGGDSGSDDGSDDGGTDDGSTDDGTTDDGSTDDGSTDDGTTDDGSTDDGSTDDGSSS